MQVCFIIQDSRQLQVIFKSSILFVSPLSIFYEFLNFQLIEFSLSEQWFEVFSKGFLIFCFLLFSFWDNKLFCLKPLWLSKFKNIEQGTFFPTRSSEQVLLFSLNLLVYESRNLMDLTKTQRLSPESHVIHSFLIPETSESIQSLYRWNASFFQARKVFLILSQLKSKLSIT